MRKDWNILIELVKILFIQFAVAKSFEILRFQNVAKLRTTEIMLKHPDMQKENNVKLHIIAEKN